VLEFENRLQVGDFVDAQDTAGKWYEAIVRDTTEDTVTIHYAGWASKWDVTLHRRIEGDDVDGVPLVREIKMCDRLECLQCLQCF